MSYYVQDTGQYKRLLIYRNHLDDALRTAAVAVNALGLQVTTIHANFDPQISQWVVEFYVPTFPVTNESEPHYVAVESGA